VQLHLTVPQRFRFTDEADVATYGGDWWVWDEVELTRLPAREIIALEEVVGMPLVAVIQGSHRNTTRGTLAAMWIAMHRGGHDVAWADFNPAALLAEWAEVPAETPLGSGEDPTPGSDSSKALPPSTESPSS
jgi:hypothetical protein